MIKIWSPTLGLTLVMPFHVSLSPQHVFVWCNLSLHRMMIIYTLLGHLLTWPVAMGETNCCLTMFAAEIEDDLFPSGVWSLAESVKFDLCLSVGLSVTVVTFYFRKSQTGVNSLVSFTLSALLEPTICLQFRLIALPLARESSSVFSMKWISTGMQGLLTSPIELVLINKFDCCQVDAIILCLRKWAVLYHVYNMYSKSSTRMVCFHSYSEPLITGFALWIDVGV